VHSEEVTTKVETTEFQHPPCFASSHSILNIFENFFNEIVATDYLYKFIKKKVYIFELWRRSLRNKPSICLHKRAET
jgi:hypothetical protein